MTPVMDPRLRKLAAQLRRSPHPAGLGLKLEAVKAGRATRSMMVRGAHTQYQGIAHGGALTALADTAATFACNSLLSDGEDSVTIELKMNFIRPVPPARARIRASARVLHRGRRTVLAQAEVLNPDGKLACLGTFTMLVIARTD